MSAIKEPQLSYIPLDELFLYLRGISFLSRTGGRNSFYRDRLNIAREQELAEKAFAAVFESKSRIYREAAG